MKHNHALLAAILSVCSMSFCQAIEPDFSYLSTMSMENLQPYLEADIPARAAPEFVGWNVPWDDTNAKNGVSIQFLGHRMIVTLGFIRGVFDSYTNTFKAEPVVSLLVEGSGGYPYVRSGQTVDSYWGGTGWNAHLTTRFDGNSVMISNYDDPADTAVVLFQELREKWAAGALRHCSKHLSKKYCLVPQNLWNDKREYQSGWVLTENTPLYHTTSLPQDYVELFKQSPPDYTFSYKPVAYSLPLRLTVVLSDPGTRAWQIRHMTAEEAWDSAMYESRRHGNLLSAN